MTQMSLFEVQKVCGLVVPVLLLYFLVMMQSEVESSQHTWSCYNETDSCYHFSDFRLGHAKASCWCRSINGRLVKFDSLEEIGFVLKLMKERDREYWVGASDNQHENRFQWEDGSTADGRIPWCTGGDGEPSNRWDQNCVILAGREFWKTPSTPMPIYCAFDDGCQHSQYFVCEKDPMRSRLWTLVSRNKIYPSAELRQLSSISLVTCADLCARTCGCLSLAHRQQDGACILYNNYISRLTGPKASPGYGHHE